MRKYAIIFAIMFIIPADTWAWFATIIDTVETRYPNGQLQEQYQQVTWEGNESTNKHGFYRAWHENGQLEWEGRYTGGVKTQTWLHWDSTGRRLEEITYRSGQKNGLAITWDQDGDLTTALRYRNDKLHGLCIWYSENNDVNTASNNACMTMIAQRFYVDGVMVLPIQEETDPPCFGGLYGGKEPYHNIENDLWVEWDDACRKFYVGRQIDGKKHGIWVLWTAAGDMERVDVFDHGQQLTF